MCFLNSWCLLEGNRSITLYYTSVRPIHQQCHCASECLQEMESWDLESQWLLDSRLIYDNKSRTKRSPKDLIWCVINVTYSDPLRFSYVYPCMREGCWFRQNNLCTIKFCLCALTIQQWTKRRVMQLISSGVLPCDAPNHSRITYLCENYILSHEQVCKRTKNLYCYNYANSFSTQ